jgi:hypothetical protein
MSRRTRHTEKRMSDAGFGSIDVGPPRKTGDDWYYAPRPAESLDAAEVQIVVGPAQAEEQDQQQEDER